MKSPLTTLLLLLSFSAAHAGPVMPASYSLLNGYGTASGGSFNYWDGSYTGSGDRQRDFAPLSGGLGDLTDGVIAAQRWEQVENLAGTGPYVGWRDIDPLIQFEFGQPSLIDRVTVHHDDANGFGNVATPSRFVIEVNGVAFGFDVVDPDGEAPLATVLNLPQPVWSDRLSLQIVRRDSGVMVSEVRFEGRQGHAVAEPASGALALLAVSACAAFRARPLQPKRARRRRTA